MREPHLNPPQREDLYFIFENLELAVLQGLPIGANVVCKVATLFLFNCSAVVGAGVVSFSINIELLRSSNTFIYNVLRMFFVFYFGEVIC